MVNAGRALLKAMFPVFSFNISITSLLATIDTYLLSGLKLLSSDTICRLPTSVSFSVK